jgi:hypothetical protein
MTANVKWPWNFRRKILYAHLKAVGFEVLTAVAMKSSILWNITPYSPIKVNRLHGVRSQKMEI